MAKGVEFPPVKRAEVIALIGQGRKLAEIAETTGVAWQTIYGWRRKDLEFADAWDAARNMHRLYRKELAEERRDWTADELYKQAERLKEDNQDAYVALLLKLHELHERQVQKLEITGDPERPVVIQHERRLTLADVLADPRIARLGGVPRRELPAAEDVLADPAEDQPAAGDLPPRPQ